MSLAAAVVLATAVTVTVGTFTKPINGAGHLPPPKSMDTWSVGTSRSLDALDGLRLAAPPGQVIRYAPFARATTAVADPKPVRVPETGTGLFDVAESPPSTAHATATFRVEAENGLPASAESFARVVVAVLADARSWTQGGENSLVRTSGPADFRIILASPHTTDTLCSPLNTRGRVSCRNGPNVVINAWRWFNGASSYRENLSGYRRYVINHEVGHALGYPHAPCASPGEAAPVMLQQTLGLEGCRPNPWPSRADLQDDVG